jgi:predicted nucleic acid-binding protein
MGRRLTTKRAAKKPLQASPPVWGNLPAGATVAVDTAPFIYVLEGHAKFADQFAGLFAAADAGELHIALSTITLAEVLTGPFKAGKTALAKRYEKALSQYTVVPVSPAIAALAAQLRVDYRLRLPDAIQLATALDIGASAFVTHDRDFSRVTGIDILTGD